jgi:uncharacterized membrane protein
VESTLSISLFTFVSLSVLTQQLFKFAFFLQAHRNPKPRALAMAMMGTMTITTFVPSFIGPVFGLVGCIAVVLFGELTDEVGISVVGEASIRLPRLSSILP